jgi:hypothetical protein
MAARWTFDHDRRLVEVVLNGDTTYEEASRFLDDLETSGAVQYNKVFDALEAAPKVDEKMIALVTQRIAALKSESLIAVVVPGAYFDGLAKLFLLAVDVSTRARVFRSVAEAHQWLEEVEAARSRTTA